MGKTENISSPFMEKDRLGDFSKYPLLKELENYLI
jgi:hypothetical protein